MYCKHCYKMIDDGSEFCRYCGQSQNKKPKKSIGAGKGIGITLLCVFMFIFLIGVLGSSDSEPQKVDASDFPGTHEETTVPSSFSKGDTVLLDGVMVKLQSITESNGSDFLAPEPGNVFLLCEFIIENYSDSDIVVSSLMCFEAYVDDYATNMSLSATASGKHNQLDGTVASGKKMNGAIGFEVPAGWSEIEIRFTPDFWSGKDIVFEYSKYSNISEPKLDEMQDHAAISNDTMDVFYQGSHDAKDLGVFYIDLKIKNKLSHEVVVNLESADVDGETVPLVATGTPVEIRSGSTATASFIFSYSPLSIDSLKDANNATFKVVFRSADSYDVLEESELVTVNLQ